MSVFDSAAAAARPLADKAVRVAASLAIAASTTLGCVTGALSGSVQEADAKKGETIAMKNTGDYIGYSGYSTMKMTYEEDDGETYFAICAEPAKSTPPSGTYTKLYANGIKNHLETQDEKNVEVRYKRLRAVLYYCNPSSPGYDKGIWPDKILEDSALKGASAKEKAIALTHLMVSCLYARSFDDATKGCSSDFKQKLIKCVTGGYMSGDGDTEYPKSVIGQIYGSGSRIDDVPDSFKIFMCDTGSSTQVLFGLDNTRYGKVKLVKTSANEAVTDGNANYTLAGAKYGVYYSKSDAESDKNRAETLTTNAAGKATSGDLETGKVYVKEIKAPKGYALDETVYTVKVQADETAAVNGGEVSDTPQAFSPGGEATILLEKTNPDGDFVSTGDGSLAGAIFKVAAPGGETWYFRTAEKSLDSAGKAVIELKGDLEKLKASNDEDPGCWLDNDFVSANEDEYGAYRSNEPIPTSADGKVSLALGKYTVSEVKAPKGYKLSGETYEFEVKADGTAAQAVLTNTRTGENLNPYTDKPKYGSAVLVKADSERGESRAQGDATLDGIEFTIYNASEKRIELNEDNGYRKVDPGSVVTTVTTSWDEERQAYTAKTPDSYLPYGTYTVKETATNGSYLLTDGTERTFEVREDGQVVELGTDGQSLTASDEVVRGGLRIVKSDKELGESEAVGGKDHSYEQGEKAGLDGIEFTICNASTPDVAAGGAEGSDGRVLVNGEWKAVGEAVGTITTSWDADLGAYVAETATDALPYGTYTVKETATNGSYLLTDGTVYTFQVRSDGVRTVADVQGKEMVFYDQVVRNDLKIYKSSASSGASLKVPFAVTNVATGETHVLATDENGQGSTASSWNRHTSNTNGNDGLLGRESIASSDIDPTAGIWFGDGEDGSAAPVTDSLAALPYGHYTLTELRCEANEGMKLISKDFWITRDSGVAEAVWMALDDQDEPAIGTKATDAADGDKYLDAADGNPIEVSDEVSYENLTPGETYTLKGTLMDKATGEAVKGADGEDVTAEAAFTPKTSAGTATVEFAFEAEGVAGKDLVAFEKLYGADGAVVATHEDIDDEDQTVHAGSIGTVAMGANGLKTVSGEAAEVVDTVNWTNMPLNRELTATAELRDAETGEVVACTSTPATFTATAGSGAVQVKLSFDASKAAGRKVTVFETVTDGSGKVVASHKVLADENQTVTACSIATTALDGTDGDKVVAADEAAVVTDKVAYKGLEAGKTYRLHGDLVQADDASKAVASADGEFTPETSEGEIGIDLFFDASDLAGKKLVVFESLTDADGNQVAEHKDASDEGQTVTVVGLKTALATADGDKTVTVTSKSKSVKLVDTVTYKGLTPGETYTLKGTLMDKATGEAVKGAKASAELIAPAANGTATVTFEVDLSKIGEKTSYVAFEKLYGADGAVVATHEDIDDEDQTVTVKPKTETPTTPEEPSSDEPSDGGETYGKTGSDIAGMAAAAGTAALAGAGLVGYGLRRRKVAEAEEE